MGPSRITAGVSLHVCSNYSVLKEQNYVWSYHYSNSLILNSCLSGEKDNKEFSIFTKKWQREVSESSQMSPECPLLENLISAEDLCSRVHRGITCREMHMSLFCT